jgi:hypothetical protein
MNGKNGNSRKSGKPRCPKTGKVRFRRSNAIKVGARMQRQQRHNLVAYQCQHCRSWHLTSMSRAEYAAQTQGGGLSP